MEHKLEEIREALARIRLLLKERAEQAKAESDADPTDPKKSRAFLHTAQEFLYYVKMTALLAEYGRDQLGALPDTPPDMSN